MNLCSEKFLQILTCVFHDHAPITAADLGFNFRGCANLAFGGYSNPPSQRIQSYLQPKSSLKGQCQRQLASACLA